jgi:hypothetical protein
VAQVKPVHAHLTTGVLAATLTPLRADGAPDARMLAEHCRGLLAQGCTSIVVLGTTGEANSFTVDERRSILETLLRSGFTPDDLIVGTGCCAAGDTIALTRHAIANGVARVLVLPPFYYKKVSDGGIFDSYARVIEGIADDRLRVYLYLIPQLSGVQIGVDLIARLLEAFPQQIAGLKDSSGDWPATDTVPGAGQPDGRARRQRVVLAARIARWGERMRERDRQRERRQHRRALRTARRAACSARAARQRNARRFRALPDGRGAEGLRGRTDGQRCVERGPPAARTPQT